MIRVLENNKVKCPECLKENAVIEKENRANEI